ncbi:MAG: hypothetical protein JWL73_1621 [Actinomycetia bacterium]|nr:hypothetical protein [Actinomycetes bacterium]
MNEEQLRGALTALAGPAGRPSPEDRDRVRHLVRRARRRVGVVGCALVLVIGLGAFTFVDATAGSSPRPVIATSSPACRSQLPRARPQAQVPPSVRGWAHNAPVVGARTLWAVRRLLTAPGFHDGSVWRLKISWFVDPPGPNQPAPVFVAREVGGTARATAEVHAATDARGSWFASTIDLPASGCYDFSIREHGFTLVFRRYVGPGR